MPASSVSEMLSQFEERSGELELRSASACYRARTWGIEEGGVPGTLTIFLHGFKNNLFSYSDLIPRLDRPSVAFDFRGHGFTSSPDAAFLSTNDYLLDLKRVVDHFGAERLVLVGHSLGARVAAVWALLYPESVKHLVLIEGLYKLYSSDSWPGRLRRWLAQADAPSPSLPDVAGGRYEQFVLRQSPNIAEDLAKYLAEKSCSLEGGEDWVPDWAPYIQRPTPFPFDDEMMSQTIEGLCVPTLALQARHGLALELAVANSRVSIERLDGGHQLHWERPAAVARAISRWLKF